MTADTEKAEAKTQTLADFAEPKSEPVAKDLPFGERLSDFRWGINNSDCTPDGVNTNQGWEFLSESKIKAIVNPILAANRLEWEITYDDLRICEAVGSMRNHYIVRATVRISDCYDRTQYKEYIAYGEGADSGDKGISKAQTNAFKNVIANSFMLSSYNAESEGILESNSSAKVAGDVKTMRNEVKDRLVANNPPIAPATQSVSGGAKPMNAIQKTAMTNIVDKLAKRAIVPADASDEENAKSAEFNRTLEPYGGIEGIRKELADIIVKNDASLAAGFIAKYKVL